MRKYDVVHIEDFRGPDKRFYIGVIVEKVPRDLPDYSWVHVMISEPMFPTRSGSIRAIGNVFPTHPDEIKVIGRL